MAFMKDARGRRLDSMPVLGGINEPGIYLPHGCMDRWYAAKSKTATQLVEVPVYGDSTTLGQASDGAGSVTWHSWLQKIRDLAIAAGMTDGGRGNVDFNDQPGLNPDGIGSSLVSKGTHWGASTDNNVALLTAGYQINGFAGEALVLQGKGTAVRVTWTKRAQGVGAFTISIDGGAPVSKTAAATSTGIDSVIFSGLTEGTHTVTITSQDTGIVSVHAAFLRSTGLVLEKVAQGGKLLKDVWNGTSNRGVQFHLGLADPTATNQALTQQPTPAFPRPPLAIMFMGGNDQSAATTDALATTGVFQMGLAVTSFGEACRLAGVDALVLLPNLKLFSNPAYAGAFGTALMQTAQMYGFGVADPSVAFGTTAAGTAAGYIYQSGVHYTPAGYDAIATWIWNNVLNRTTAP